MAILKTEELTYVYSQGTPFEKTAVDHVNLEIEKGEFVGVIGHTGSGKSTIINYLLTQKFESCIFYFCYQPSSAWDGAARSGIFLSYAGGIPLSH